MSDPGSFDIGLVGGQNQFDELDEQAGLYHGDGFRLYGGHRHWVRPEVERTYYPDNRPVEVKAAPTGAVFTAPIEANLPERQKPTLGFTPSEAKEAHS